MIGLVDCNNFFVSCERLFRPDLLRKPVLVLSSNDGCVVSRSQEVKDMGISMGVPHFQIKDMCKREGITAFSSNFALYKDISRRVMFALKDEFPSREIYSIDEAFFDIGNTCTEESLLEVRERITKKTGIPVSISVAETKTLAKIAGKFAKSGNGVYILSPLNREQVISVLPCGSVWGIGRQLSLELSRRNVDSVGEFLKLDSSFISDTFGVVGTRLFLELSGQSVYRITDHDGCAQESFTSTRSFSSLVQSKTVLASAISHHVMNVSERMRLHKLVGGRLTVIAKGSRFGDFSHKEGSMSVDLLQPTNNVLTLTKEALKLLDVLFDPEIPYKKAGVIVGGIFPEDQAATSLFRDLKHDEGMRTLNNTIDSLNDHLGKGVVQIASAFGGNAWKEKRKLVSKEYTTKWEDIALVKAI